MKKVLLFLVVNVISIPLFSQLLSWSPNFLVDGSTPVEITMDGSKGNTSLNFYTPQSDVYVHTGVITNLSTSSTDWRYVQPGNFNTTVLALNAPYLSGTFPYKWKFTIYGGLRAYYGITNPAEVIQKIAILFRNGNGTKVQRNADGSDMYIPISDGSLKVKFTAPFIQPTYIPTPEPITKLVGDNISLTAVASSAQASTTMKIYFNGTVIQSATASSTISATANIVVSGTQTVVAEAFDGSSTKTDTLRFFVAGTPVIQALPTGVKDGINYDADNTKATLVLYAPGKTRVTVIGDLPSSNWSEQAQYQMKNTPDGNYWWTTITGLTPGTEYAFQYLVDGSFKIGEPYSEKVLDPWNDQYIPSVTYPALKPYPTGLTSGVVSVLQTAATSYNWQSSSYLRPDKRNLMVYELLLRDYLVAHDWKTLTDTLNYIKKLGINTIELMPINEFEGNLSWGYNPDYYLAPDKYYGPKNELKAFVDSCHKRNIAVVMDIALNHSFGLSPLVQLYWDASNNRPASNNPWFNTVAKHDYNVGYDFNHESLATRYFTSRVVTHWLTEYKMDGFRFDLSKGFTQNQTCDNNGANCNSGNMSLYDASRIAIWKKYYDTLQLKSPGSYAILEHFAANSEELELSNYGFLLWGNVNNSFNEAAMGYVATSNFDWALHIARGWSQPNVVAYMESHDEERLMYKTMLFGNSSSGYDTKNFATAINRMKLCASFFLTIPGPKMIWQFGELGYDYSINYCPSNGTVNSSCRTDSKPIKWDYLQVSERKSLYNVYKALLQLRNTPLYSGAFTIGNISRDFSSGFKWMTLNDVSAKVVVVGNFDVVAQSGSVTFPASGTWYDYLNAPATFSATGGSQFMTLQPGDFHVYISSNVVVPVTLLSFSGKNMGSENQLNWEVASEQKLSHYEVERSDDAIHFSTLGKIVAMASPNYQFSDQNIGKYTFYYYRLKKVDVDGDYSYSSTIRLSGSVKGINVYVNPNPFKEVLKVTVVSPNKQDISLYVTDVSGKQLCKKVITLDAGVSVIDVPETRVLRGGAYFLSIQSNQTTKNLKILKVL